MQLALARPRFASIVALALLAVLALVVSSIARPLTLATTYYVNAATGSSSNTGLNWLHAFDKIETAISAASSGDTIWVAAAHYTPMSSTPGDGYQIGTSLNIYGGFEGTEFTLADRAGLFETTVLDATSSSRVFTITGSSSSQKVVIDGFKIVNGAAYQATTATNLGGGIYCDGSALLLGNDHIVSNRAAGSGGGLYFTDSSATHEQLDIKLTEFRENWAENKGGAIFGAFLHSGDVVNTVFNTNTTTSSDGGAVYLEDMGSTNQVWFTNGIFWRNSAGGSGKGGGLCLGETSSTGFGNAMVVNCTFVANDVNNPVTNGQAISISSSSACEVYNSILYFNGTGGVGGVLPYAGTLAGLSYSCIETLTGPTLPAGPPQFRSISSPSGLTLKGGPPPSPMSPCLDFANKNRLPDDHLDVNGDGVTAGKVPIDMNGAGRDANWNPAPNQGTPSGTYVDINAVNAGTPSFSA